MHARQQVLTIFVSPSIVRAAGAAFVFTRPSAAEDSTAAASPAAAEACRNVLRLSLERSILFSFWGLDRGAGLRRVSGGLCRQSGRGRIALRSLKVSPSAMPANSLKLTETLHFFQIPEMNSGADKRSLCTSRSRKPFPSRRFRPVSSERTRRPRPKCIRVST